jgi:hypothetical protein
VRPGCFLSFHLSGDHAILHASKRAELEMWIVVLFSARQATGITAFCFRIEYDTRLLLVICTNLQSWTALSSCLTAVSWQLASIHGSLRQHFENLETAFKLR